ncbi:pyridoxamine 5'-phosphate oxidase family protein [Streptomyces sp. NPDC005423]|uniref:helix-turn-helix domain-containing protein n=1 Tax=Streptomyces sp. NPDC005423 TaxID=3155343 RepID=UPI0033B4BD4A
MNEQVPSNVAEGHAVGDLGNRIATRRAELGLSRQETAVRAGMAPSYLQYLEEHSVAAPGTGVLRQLADVLHTTATQLTGGATELPPGRGRAARAPEFTELTPQECRALLATHGVGRIAVPTASGPLIVPVNYSVVDGAIVFRTAPGSTPSQASGCRVSFEVDRVDDAFSEGWSVLVTGRARTVTDADAVRLLARRAFSTPWAGGDREEWVRVDPLGITGRRITTR